MHTEQENNDSITRKRNSEQLSKWSLILKDWKESGLSKKDFCITKKITYSQFIYYHGKALADKMSAVDEKFLPVKIGAESQSFASCEPLVLHHPSGLKISIPSRADTETFKRVVTVMKELT